MPATHRDVINITYLCSETSHMPTSHRGVVNRANIHREADHMQNTMFDVYSARTGMSIKVVCMLSRSSTQ